MAFQTGSDNEKIDKLQRQLDDVLDSQISSVSGNANISIDASLGGRNAASGDEGGVRSNQPIIHKITDVDEAGTSTGVFDKINLISSMIIVDHTSTPMNLKFIQGPAKDGAKIKITVKKDKILVLKTGGSILTSSDITITDTEYYELVKHSEAETGVTGGAYKILKIGSGGTSGYTTIQDEGTPVTQRSIMNFIGGGVIAVDNPGQSRTDITISGGSSEFFGPWTNTHDAGNQILDKLSILKFNTSGQQIATDSAGIIYTTPDLKAHIFKSVSDEIARFEESAAGVFRLDMKEHSIKDAKDIRFDVAATNTIPSNIPGIGFNVSDNALKLNVPTGKQFNLEFNAVKIYDFTIARMTGPSIILSNSLSLTDISVDPTFAGQFRRNGADVKVFTGGVVKNLSDISGAAGANVNLSNLEDTVAINKSLLFGTTGLNIGDTTNPADQVFLKTVRLQTGLITVNKPSITSINGNSIDLNFPTVSNLNILEQGIIKHTFSSTSLTTPNIILSGQLFFNDSLGFPATTGGIQRRGSDLGISIETLSIRRNTSVAADDPRLDLVRVDTSPNNDDLVGKLRFRIFDDPITTTYAQIQVIATEITDAANFSIDVRADNGIVPALAILGHDSSQNFTFIVGGVKPRIQPFIGPMGYFVTSQVADFSKNIGTAGTLEIPKFADNNPSVNDLNQAAGDFDSVVIYETVDHILYIRENSTTWRKINTLAL